MNARELLAVTRITTLDNILTATVDGNPLNIDRWLALDLMERVQYEGDLSVFDCPDCAEPCTTTRDRFHAGYDMCGGSYCKHS